MFTSWRSGIMTVIGGLNAAAVYALAMGGDMLPTEAKLGIASWVAFSGFILGVGNDGKVLQRRKKEVQT